MNEKTNYGNWVPEKALYLLFGLAAVFLTITVLLRGLVQIPVLTIIMGVVFVLTAVSYTHLPGLEDNGNVIQVISAACEDCPISSYTVTENCQNCMGTVSYTHLSSTYEK